jgi:ribosomal protein S6--L-glutamate ligase
MDARVSQDQNQHCGTVMRIGILSQNPDSYSTRRLSEAAAKAGHEARVIDYLRCWMNIASHKPVVMYEGEPLTEVDAVIPRIAASMTFYGCAVLRQFEMMGVFTANASIAVARARDKLRCLQILSRKGIGLPVTAFSHSSHDVNGLIEAVGGPPLIVKLIEGTQGMGVVLAETPKSAQSVIQAFRGLHANFLVQEFIREAEGTDIRCFVIGEKIAATMARRAPPGEFRANIHRGGTGEPVKLTPEERSAALRAAKAMGLKIAGVDLMRSNHGPVVLEVNASPGLEGIEGATNIDVATKIINFVAKTAHEDAATHRHSRGPH